MQNYFELTAQADGEAISLIRQFNARQTPESPKQISKFYDISLSEHIEFFNTQLLDFVRHLHSTDAVNYQPYQAYPMMELLYRYSCVSQTRSGLRLWGDEFCTGLDNLANLFHRFELFDQLDRWEESLFIYAIDFFSKKSKNEYKIITTGSRDSMHTPSYDLAGEWHSIPTLSSAKSYAEASVIQEAIDILSNNIDTRSLSYHNTSTSILPYLAQTEGALLSRNELESAGIPILAGEFMRKVNVQKRTQIILDSGESVYAAPSFDHSYSRYTWFDNRSVPMAFGLNLIDREYNTIQEYLSRVRAGYSFDGGFPAGRIVPPGAVTHIYTDSTALPYVENFARDLYPQAQLFSYEAIALAKLGQRQLEDCLLTKPIVIRKHDLRL